MKIKKPLFWDNKNLIALLLIPLSTITILVNFLKSFLLKRNYNIKTICVGNVYVGGTGKTSLSIEINNILKKKTDVYIVDTYGEASKFYLLSRLTFVGGSLVFHGGQNPLEPAREGNYILHGRYIDNFKEVYKMLENMKIAKKIKSIKNMKSLVLKKINYSENLKVKYRLNKLGEKIINRNILEIKKFI